MLKTNSLILLHGALGSKMQFAGLQELLAPDFDVHAFNFSGHGGMPLREAFSIDLFCHDLTQYIKEHELLQPHVFGYSMGGYVALHCARKFPGLLNRIMTLGTKMHWDPDAAAKETRMLRPDIIEQKIPAFGEALRKRHAPADWKQNMTFTAGMMTDLGNGLALTADDLALISNDVLLCVGEEDQMVTQEETRWATEHLQHGQFRVVPAWKHQIEAVDKSGLAGMMRRYFIDAALPPVV